MTLTFFEGPAGSGKTTSLMKELESVLARSPCQDHQRVLALTRMHGSRRRLDARLRAFPGLTFTCLTFDSFARQLVTRWRSLARALGGDDAIARNDFEAISALVGRLLDRSYVRSWVAATYPVVLVDELQDSKGGQLAMLRSLESQTMCLAAADAFQDLDGAATNEAVEWARVHGQVVSLETIHRTSVAGLLGAATALRSGAAVAGGRGFRVLAKHANFAAYEVAIQLYRWWSQHDEIAVITPVSPERSAFVRHVLNRVAAKPIGKDPEVGPYRIPWETAQDVAIASLAAEWGLPEDRDVYVPWESLRTRGSCRTHAGFMRWVERHGRLTGATSLTAGELRDQLALLVHQSRAHGSLVRRRVVALTVHQAKNREFDAVIVLWPYEAPKHERARRLLYNAITRARKTALVIAQGPKCLGQVPFIATPTGPVLPGPRRRSTHRGGAVHRNADPEHHGVGPPELWSQQHLWL